MSRLINVKHANVVILGLRLRLLVDHRGGEEASQLSVRDGIAKVRIEPLIQCLLALGKCERLLCLRADHLLEFIDEEFAVFGHQEANAFKLTRVLPHVQRGRLKADLAAALVNASKCLLPLMQVKHTILSNIDGVEEVLDDRVCGDFLPRELVSFRHKLAEVSEGNTAILFSVELFAQKRVRVDVTHRNDQAREQKEIVSNEIEKETMRRLNTITELFEYSNSVTVASFLNLYEREERVKVKLGSRLGLK